MNLDKENMKKILLIAFAIVLFYVGVGHLDVVFNGLKWVIALVFPFLFGACIAFILNVPMRSIERSLFGGYHGKRQKLINRLRRPVSFALTLICVLGIICIVVLFVAPQLGETIQSIIERIPDSFNQVQLWINEMLDKYQVVAEALGDIKINWDSIANHLTEFLKNGVSSVFTSTVGIAASIVNGLTTFFIGFVFAIYILFQKENLSRQVKKLMYAYAPEKRVDRIVEIAGISNRIFSRFLSGQCLEATILGTMFFITLTIFRFPYALLIGVLIAFTALIPIVGAFIGCFIGALLMLMVSPMKMVIFVIIFLVLQQIEGNIIYPKVVGNSIGLPAIWVLAAVTIGGSLMGIAGMLIFIPLVSVLYTLLRDAVRTRIKKRQIKPQKYSS